METETDHGYRGHWAGPAAVVVLGAAALIVLGWLEAGLLQALMHG